jgi:hypothetical protein
MKMKKERKPSWEVAHAMKDIAWRMIEDIRGQVRNHKDRYMFPSKMVVSGAEIELTLTRSDVTKTKDISMLSCAYERRVPDYVTSSGVINRGTWEEMKEWIMGSQCIDEVAKKLDYQDKHTVYWD